LDVGRREQSNRPLIPGLQRVADRAGSPAPATEQRQSDRVVLGGMDGGYTAGHHRRTCRYRADAFQKAPATDFPTLFRFRHVVFSLQ
jgi:hypothetical protein